MMYENAESFSIWCKQQLDDRKRKCKTRKNMAKIQKRITELDKIFKRIYEDDITGAISHERFLKLSAEYENEQKELQKQVKISEKTRS